MSDMMREFLKAYLDWADGGRDRMPNGCHFTGYNGLCNNWKRWIDDVVDSELLRKYLYELEGMFDADGLDLDYPFGESSYEYYTARGKAQEDTDRINWIKEKLEAAQ